MCEKTQSDSGKKMTKDEKDGMANIFLWLCTELIGIHTHIAIVAWAGAIGATLCASLMLITSAGEELDAK